MWITQIQSNIIHNLRTIFITNVDNKMQKSIIHNLRTISIPKLRSNNSVQQQLKGFIMAGDGPLQEGKVQFKWRHLNPSSRKRTIEFLSCFLVSKWNSIMPACRFLEGTLFHHLIKVFSSVREEERRWVVMLETSTNTNLGRILAASRVMDGELETNQIKTEH